MNDLPAFSENSVGVSENVVQKQRNEDAVGGGKIPEKKQWKPEHFQVDPVPGKIRFHDIGLPDRLMHAIADLKFKYCTPVQAESFPHIIGGGDLVGNANTGTGKTAVFLIGILARIQKQRKKRSLGFPQALIIAPTRELVIQIAKDGRKLSKHSGVRVVAVYGGSDYTKQQDQLQRKPTDIVVATPGRLLDFTNKKIVRLGRVDNVVIDEADRMLDMGFIPDVRRIMHQLPEKNDRQTLMFSATITEEVKRLASQWCRDPKFVVIEEEKVTVDTVDQRVYLATAEEKYAVIYNTLQQEINGRVLIFANQKIEARKLYDRLCRNNIHTALLTGDVPQKKRLDRLERFRSGRVKVLVATDVAGRGIHIEGITHVINYSLPYEPEDYVHRIGRTGRAGAEGVAISFACEEGGFVLPDIEQFIGRKLECAVPEEGLLKSPPKGKNPVPHGNHQKKRRRKKRSGYAKV